MSRLVLVRVGNPGGLWSITNSTGIWSSPECHEQVIRNMFTEGYRVYALFAGTGDKPLMAARITGVRLRSANDSLILPEENELGKLSTVITFDRASAVDLTQSLSTIYANAREYVKFLVGSQILILPSIADPIISNISLSQVNTIYRGNYTVINPEYLINLNINGC